VAQYNTGPGVHEIVPDDFATIYDITPLYNAGINGSGQSIAIVGQSALVGTSTNPATDITTFWSKFGISAKLVQKLIGRSPGVVQGDVDESSLDVEWAGAVARNATVIFVYSNNVWTSAMSAVDQDYAPVLSMSYGNCEAYDLVDMPSNRALVQQANAEGITWFAASGDQGAADCDNSSFADPVLAAEAGLAVDAPASIPEITAMGGTMFNDAGGGYWNGTNSSTLASARGYIPESVWNETSAVNGLAASGGGASMYFPQPAWQASGGVPNDGWRHVPDISFSASFDRDGYYVYSQGFAGAVGGTSAATPTMAGVAVLLNQYLLSSGAQSQAGLGNINPVLYRLAQSAPNTFHDVVSGSNIVACAYGSPDCYNYQLGYSAGTGYDSATGLGSVDIANLVHNWRSQIATGSLVVPSIDNNPVPEITSGANGHQWPFNLTLTEEAGIGTTLTDFTINGTSYAAQIVSLFGSASIPPRGSLSASYTLSLPSVPANETFGFSGMDANGDTWTTALTAPFSGPQTNLSVAGVSNAATGQKVFAPGMILSVYGAGLGDLVEAAGTIPLPAMMGGFEATFNVSSPPYYYPAALYYVSPNQVNLQIPYEIGTGTASLSLGTPYQSINYSFTVSAAGPGIFMFPDGFVNPSRTGSVGQVVSMYITGEGMVSPSLPDGTTPSPGTPLAQLPKPRQAYSVTVGGVAATINFIGIPNGLVGVTQINFTIPPVAAGTQPVVVTVGKVASPAANITVQ
jgi:uncharacterized protein (TIGR03437 family)